MSWHISQSLSPPPMQFAGQHMSLSMHCWMTIDGPPQRPFWQWVPIVQPSPSSHAWPLIVGTPFRHCPFMHFSFVVHGLPSLPGTSTHWSMTRSHWPMWHESFAGHGAGEPLQTPIWHESSCVQFFPSSHAPFSLAGHFWHAPFTQVPALQASVCHAQSSAFAQGPCTIIPPAPPFALEPPPEPPWPPAPGSPPPPVAASP